MNIFQAVKNETNIVDVYQDLTGNSVSGINKNVNCPSPGHIDKTPSCKLYPDTNSFNCFGLGCNAGGSVIDMVQQVQGTSPLEAAQWLADRYSIQYEDLTPEAKEQIQKRQTRKEIMTSFIEKSHKRLTAEHRNLLHTRGLSDETIDTYKIGYCPRFTRDQVKDLKNNNPEKYQDHKLIGLINDNDSFIPGDRIIIPFWRYNEPIYWVSWDNNQSDYKYLNPAGMEKPVIFHIANNDNAVYITEGVFDFYSLVEAGKNVIAVLGSKTKDTLINKLQRMKGKTLYIAFDNDSDKEGKNPGQEAAEMLAQTLWPDIQAEILNLPGGTDINDLLKDECNCNTEAFINKLEGLTSDLIIERSIEWEDPINFTDYNVEQINPDILPEWLKNFAINLSEFTQSPVDMSIMLIIAALGTALAKKVVIQIKRGYTEPLNIWTCTVLPAANRKSPVFKRVMKPILQYEERKRAELEPERRHALKEKAILEEQLKQMEKQASSCKDRKEQQALLQDVFILDDEVQELDVPALPRLVASDVTAEKLAKLMEENGGRIAVLSPEGDIFKLMAGRYSKSGSTNFENYKKGWTGGEPIRDDRMGRKGTHVRNPAITLGLTVQPVVFEDLTDKRTFRGEGLLGRFLYAIPESPVGSRKTGQAIPDLSELFEARYCKGLSALLNLNPSNDNEAGEMEPNVIKLSTEALKIRNEFEAEIEKMLGDGGDLQNIPDWGGKLVGNITRVAGLLHIAAHINAEKGQISQDIWNTTVSMEAMNNAVVLGRQLVHHALKVFDLLEADPELELARYVLKRIKKGVEMEQAGELPKGKDKLDTSALYQLVRKKSTIKQPDDLKEPLNFLEKMNFIKVIEKPNTGPGRPPAPLIKLNPKEGTINTINTIKTAENDNKEYLEYKEYPVIDINSENKEAENLKKPNLSDDEINRMINEIS